VRAVEQVGAHAAGDGLRVVGELAGCAVAAAGPAVALEVNDGLPGSQAQGAGDLVSVAEEPGFPVAAAGAAVAGQVDDVLPGAHDAASLLQAYGHVSSWTSRPMVMCQSSPGLQCLQQA
jgi:hypothetical protein